mmetsp:Transcript_6266/g.10202  ORF Transcript_6266/g.10202 Transcript_6266/m.10202 type:complete len:140 (-) Transcript_6266:421-840(-)
MRTILHVKPVLDAVKARRRPFVQQDLYTEDDELTIDDYMTYAAAVADGLNMEDDLENVKTCVYDFIDLYLRLETDVKAIEDISYSTDESGNPYPELFGDILDKDEVYELALALGNISSTYQQCWTDVETSLTSAVAWGT